MAHEQLDAEHFDSDLADPLSDLASLDSEECVALPPRRLPLRDGEECLVQWAPGKRTGQWQLRLSKRPVSVDDTAGEVRQFQATLDLLDHSSAVAWQDADADFRDWVRRQLPEIAAETRDLQRQERQILAQRAQVSGQRTTVKDFIPHIVILLALAAFAYMFAAVHIKI